MEIKENKYHKICIIGAGRVGTALAFLINNESRRNKSAGFKLAAVCSRTRLSIERAKEFIKEKETGTEFEKKVSGILFSTDNIKGVGKSDVIFICTPDDTIYKVAEEIALSDEKSGNLINGKIFIHFSGAKPLKVLDPVKQKGGRIASIHPVKSFASVSQSVKTIKKTYYGVTFPENCPDELHRFIKNFIDVFKGKIIEVPDSKKTVYHAAACVASNYLVSLIDYAIRINEKIGIKPEDSLAGLTGLIEGTVLNIKKLGTKNALTGPIARGDTGTVKEHMDSFKKYFDKKDYEIYRLMGAETARIAFENKWISRQAMEKFLEILS